jgi:DNA-binding LacI/PurR family transcriptional regulator
MQEISTATLTPKRRGRPANNASQEGPRARVIRYIKERIENKELTEGQVLPSIQALSQTLQVDWRTVNSALDMLTSDGVLRSNGGRLRIVSEKKVAPASTLMESAIVVITHEPESRLLQRGPESGQIAEISRGVAHGITEAGSNMFVLHADWLQTQGIQPLLNGGRPRGVVLADFVYSGEEPAQWAQAFREAGIPVVVFGDTQQLKHFDHVESDHYKGAHLLTQFLLQRGCKQILNVWSQSEQKEPVGWKIQRRAGYEQALRESGIEPLPTLCWSLRDGWHLNRRSIEHEAHALAGYLFPYLNGASTIDAIMALNDAEFFLIAAACRILGKEPQRDIAIVGYDNAWTEPEWAAIDPAVPLATVDKHNRQLGHEMVQLLCERVAGELPSEPQCRAVEPQLVVVGTA